MIQVQAENWKQILAKNIEMERNRLNLNQNDLAELVGLGSYATISVWENARGLPKMEIFERLCRVFGRTPTQLMYENLSDQPPPKLKPIPTEGGELQETDVGASKATESPPPKGKEERLQAAERKILDLTLELRELRDN